MQTMAGSVFSDVPAHSAEELVTALVTMPGARIERIVSTGQASPPGFWYDQAQAEWVMVLSGSAVLRFADEAEPYRMGPGDYLFISPHRRHRVEQTAPDAPTIWLAVHFGWPA